MRKVSRIEGDVTVLDRSDVDTDQIIPKQFLKRIERTGFGEFLFWDWRDAEGYRLHDPEYEGATILVAGRNFGCGSSREHAPWALQDFGFRVIIAESFADIFRTNCTKIGILPITLPADEVEALMRHAHEHPDVPIEIDLERGVVLDAHEREIAFELEGGTRERLLRGWDDISITLEHEGLIDDYEREREREEGPVTLPFA